MEKHLTYACIYIECICMHKIPITSTGFVGFLLVSCAHGDYRPTNLPTPIAVDSELEGLKVLAALPGAQSPTQLALAQQFMATGRGWQGLAYFDRHDSGRGPVALALQGVFRAHVADEVPLWKRVSWVDDALERLDRAAASGHAVARLFLGVVSAAVPKRFGRAQVAVRELTWVREHPQVFLVSVERGALYGLAQAYSKLGDHKKSMELLQRSGHKTLDPNRPVFFDTAAWTEKEGFRFSSPPRLDEVAPGVFVASGYDFADQIFIDAGPGIVAIDACSSPKNAREALRALRTRTEKPITHVIVTHSHRDHVGGLRAYAAQGVEVIAHKHHRKVAGRLKQSPGVRNFWPDGWQEPPPNPTTVVETRQTVVIGERQLELIPTTGGETEDALLILDKATSTLVVGDVLMPFLGAPFVNEGSPEGVIDSIRTIRSLSPKQLLHGHTPLTKLYRMAAMAGLESALSSLLAEVRNEMAKGRSEAQVIAKNIIPDPLRAAPAAALPYIVMRNHFIQRTFRQVQGYWGGEGAGLAPQTRAAWARAADLLTDSNPARFEQAAQNLLHRGDLTLAFDIADLGVRSYPDHKELQRIRSDTLQRLRAKYHAVNPFKFIIYSAMSGQELPSL